jgi:hypothetical protein
MDKEIENLCQKLGGNWVADQYSDNKMICKFNSDDSDNDDEDSEESDEDDNEDQS